MDFMEGIRRKRRGVSKQQLLAAGCWGLFVKEEKKASGVSSVT